MTTVQTDLPNNLESYWNDDMSAFNMELPFASDLTEKLGNLFSIDSSELKPDDKFVRYGMDSYSSAASTINKAISAAPITAVYGVLLIAGKIGSVISPKTALFGKIAGFGGSSLAFNFPI